MPRADPGSPTTIPGGTLLPTSSSKRQPHQQTQPPETNPPRPRQSHSQGENRVERGSCILIACLRHHRRHAGHHCRIPRRQMDRIRQMSHRRTRATRHRVRVPGRSIGKRIQGDLQTNPRRANPVDRQRQTFTPRTSTPVSPAQPDNQTRMAKPPQGGNHNLQLQTRRIPC